MSQIFFIIMTYLYNYGLDFSLFFVTFFDPITIRDAKNQFSDLIVPFVFVSLKSLFYPLGKLFDLLSMAIFVLLVYSILPLLPHSSRCIYHKNYSLSFLASSSLFLLLNSIKLLSCLKLFKNNLDLCTSSFPSILWQFFVSSCHMLS